MACAARKSVVVNISTKTEPRFYVHKINGVNSASFVSEENKSDALAFLSGKAAKWKSLLEDMTGCELELFDCERGRVPYG